MEENTNTQNETENVSTPVDGQTAESMEETGSVAPIESQYPQVTSEQVLLGQGLVEVYDAFNDCMRQVSVEKALQLAQKDEALKQKLISLGVEVQ